MTLTERNTPASAGMEITEAWNGRGREDDTLTTVLPRHNAAHPVPRNLSFEHWYFDATLDDGRTVIAFLNLRRPEEPAAVARPNVEILVYAPDGTRRQVRRRYPRARASASIVACDVRIGDNHAAAEFPEGGLPVHHVHVSEDGITLDLTFVNEVPSWMPGGGETRFGNTEVFGWCVGAPRAAVTGTVVVDGVRTSVRGRGYADHNWGFGDMTKVIDHWHWGRLYDDDYSLLFASVLTQERRGRHRSQPLMLARRGEIVMSTGLTELTEGPPVFDARAGRTRPEWIALEVPGRLSLRLDVEEVVHAQDLLDDVPVARSRLVRPLAHRLVGHPGYFRFLSSFELTVTGDGETDVRRGRTLHELVALS